MLVTKFYIKDIKKFEEEEHKSVIDILKPRLRRAGRSDSARKHGSDR